MRYFVLACSALFAGAGLGSEPRLGGAVATNSTQTDRPRPDYFRDIAPILARSCVPCHTRGGCGPYAIESYETARRRARDIAVATTLRTMPPIHGRSDFGQFSAVPLPTAREIESIKWWAEGGCPRGDPPPKPISAHRLDGWRLGRPTTVVHYAATFSCPAEGPPVWRTFAVPLDSASRGRLIAIELKPNNPSVVRAAMVGIASATSTNRDRRGTATVAGSGIPPTSLVGGWAIGCLATRFPRGAGVVVPRGSVALVEVRCHPAGVPEDVGFELGLYFDAAAHGPSPRCLTLTPRPTPIPFGSSHFVARASTTIQSDCDAIGIVPEMGPLGSELTVWVQDPDGRRRKLFEDRVWDPFWTGNYRFSSVALRAGTRLEAVFVFNNSSTNPRWTGGSAPEPIGSAGKGGELAQVVVQVVDVSRRR